LSFGWSAEIGAPFMPDGVIDEITAFFITLVAVSRRV
jgi:hypothetical protein